MIKPSRASNIRWLLEKGNYYGFYGTTFDTIGMRMIEKNDWNAYVLVLQNRVEEEKLFYFRKTSESL